MTFLPPPASLPDSYYRTRRGERFDTERFTAGQWFSRTGAPLPQPDGYAPLSGRGEG